MKKDVLTLRALQALIGLQLLGGIVSIFTLNLGRTLSLFGSAALIYLGITIIQQLLAIREILSYTSTQQPVKSEGASTNILQQLRKNKQASSPTESPAKNRNVRQAEGKRPVMAAQAEELL
jgi:hypothetical protein